MTWERWLGEMSATAVGNFLAGVALLSWWHRYYRWDRGPR